MKELYKILEEEGFTRQEYVTGFAYHNKIEMFNVYVGKDIFKGSVSITLTEKVSKKALKRTHLLWEKDVFILKMGVKDWLYNEINSMLFEFFTLDTTQKLTFKEEV